MPRCAAICLLVLLYAWRGWRHGFKFAGRQTTQPSVWDEPLAFILVVIVASRLLRALEHQILQRLAN